MVPAKYNYFGRLVIIAPVPGSLRRFRAEIPLIPAVQIPQTTSLHLFGGNFVLEKRTKLSGWPNVITIFLRSLARNWDGILIAVIVSGLDADGAEALKEVKEAGGITIAQTPEAAEWSDMPDSAIKTGYVDYVLSAETTADKILEIASQCT